MVNGLLGKKIGMTQVYDESGRMIPVTIIEAGPCYVLSSGNVKDKIKLGFCPTKENRLNKPLRSLFKKANAPYLRFIKEVKIEEGAQLKEGQQIKVDIFDTCGFVDVTGISIGKGFQGGMKRWHWHGGPKTHGSMSHRRVGSIGSSAWPSRVLKGRHLPGHMGAKRTTRQNLKVVKLDLGNNLLIVKGPVPGHKNNILLINKSKKKKSVQKSRDATENR